MLLRLGCVFTATTHIRPLSSEYSEDNNNQQVVVVLRIFTGQRPCLMWFVVVNTHPVRWFWTSVQLVLSCLKWWLWLRIENWSVWISDDAEWLVVFCLCWDFVSPLLSDCFAFSSLTPLVGHQEEPLACKELRVRWWHGLEQGACDLHMVQLMPVPPHRLLLH